MSTAHTFDQSRTLAPWVEIVPGAGPATVDDLLALPDDGWQYEVVEGVLVRMAGSGEEATIIAGLILTALNVFVRPQRLGRVTDADGVYRFRCKIRFRRCGWRTPNRSM